MLEQSILGLPRTGRFNDFNEFTGSVPRLHVCRSVELLLHRLVNRSGIDSHGDEFAVVEVRYDVPVFLPLVLICISVDHPVQEIFEMRRTPAAGLGKAPPRISEGSVSFRRKDEINRRTLRGDVGVVPLGVEGYTYDC